METKQEKQKPEVAVAREYFSLTYHAWWLNHNGHKWGMTNEQIIKDLSALEPHIIKSRDEAQARFVDPQQKNKHELNKRIGFQDWYSGWSDFFNGMPKEKYKEFEKLEKQYHEQGTCEEYEQIKCPKQYKKKVVDLTVEECAELEKVKEDTMKFINLLKQYKEKHTKFCKMASNTKGIKTNNNETKK